MPSVASAGSSYRARLRVRLRLPLRTKDKVRTFELAGRQVTVSTQPRGQALDKTAWLQFRADGFPTEDAARAFEESLRMTVGIAGLSCFLGAAVDGIPPSGISASLFDAQNFIGALSELGKNPPELGSLEEGFRLLNLALINPEPLARLLLALSAVDALGQTEEWSDNQKNLLGELAAQAELGGSQEAAEVAEALRAKHPLSLRQGVKRVLGRYGLDRAFKEWDKIYEKRSGIFHGTSRLTDAEVIQLSDRAVRFCGHVFLVIATKSGVELPSIAHTHVPAGNVRD